MFKHNIIQKGLIEDGSIRQTEMLLSPSRMIREDMSTRLKCLDIRDPLTVVSFTKFKAIIVKISE